MNADFVGRHKWDSWFWAVVWAYCLIVILFGFAPPVKERFFDGTYEPASIALQIHVWSFSAWISLLAIQAFLAGKGQLKWHQQFGMVMLPLAVIMVLSAGAAELESAQRAIAAGRDVNFRATTFGTLICFSVLVPLAWVARKSPAAHKRLILMATASIMSGAHFRVWGRWWPEEWFDESFLSRLLFFFGGAMIVITFGMIYDLMTRKALHPIYKICVPIIIAAQVLLIVAYDSAGFDAWLRPILAGI